MSIARAASIVGALLLVLLVTACSSKQQQTSTSAETTSSAASEGASPAAVASGATETSAPMTGASGSASPLVTADTEAATPAATAIGGSGWDANATALRGHNGGRFTFICPSGGAPGSVWGTDVYTDDSGVCTAAVHAGLITLRNGGTVTIEIRPGTSAYAGSVRNGITSGSWGGWSGSYVFVRGGGGTISNLAGISWDANATAFRGHNGERLKFACPPGGSPGSVWGTDTYTDDSQVCSAAVHAGLITLQRGGTVTIEIRPGLSSYMATTRNGIASGNWGSWAGSYVFVH